MKYEKSVPYLNYLKIKSFIIIVLLSFIFIYPSYAQDCGCDYYVEPFEEEIWYVTSPSAHRHQKHWNLKRKGETVICLKSGQRSRLYIRNFNGGINNDGSKYVIRNCGGQVEIKAPKTDGITFYNCQDMKLSGRGDSTNAYGIKVSETRTTGTNYGNAFGIAIQNYSEKIEIEFVEITNTGFAAITAKSANVKYYPDGVTEFVMRDCRFHDNYIHDLIKGEGFYVGHNQWNYKTQHRVDGIYIYNNKLVNIPWDAIQVGGSCNAEAGKPGNAEIHDNVIFNYGIDKSPQDPWQDNGINLSSGFSGKCYNNFIMKGPDTKGGNGIIAGGIGDVHIFNNIIIEPAEAGIFINDSKSAPAEKDKSFYIYNNTIVNSKGPFIEYKIPATISKGYLINNLLVGGSPVSIISKGSSLTEKANYHLQGDINKVFVNADKDNFQLRSTAVNIISKGCNLSGDPFRLTFDFSGKPRPLNNAPFDIGAFQYAEKGSKEETNEGSEEGLGKAGN